MEWSRGKRKEKITRRRRTFKEGLELLERAVVDVETVPGFDDHGIVGIVNDILWLGIDHHGAVLRAIQCADTLPVMRWCRALTLTRHMICHHQMARVNVRQIVELGRG